VNQKLTILLYHGVTESVSKGIENISGKHIHARKFHDQMKFLKKHCNIISMEDVYLHYKNNIPFKLNTVAITFDDGFKNNSSVALPILDNLEIPATFYIASGLIGTENMFWVDKIEDCLNLTEAQTIQINIFNERLKFDLSTREEKINSLRDIKRICKSSTNSDKDQIIDQIINQTKVNPTPHCDNYKIMDWDDLKKLEASKNTIIGGHSMGHEILSKLNKDQMIKNINTSIEILENRLGIKIDHYSYPEGQEDHYDEYVISALKSAGIKCCPSAINGLNSADIDLFNLRRIMVGFNEEPFPKEMFIGN